MTKSITWLIFFIRIMKKSKRWETMEKRKWCPNIAWTKLRFKMKRRMNRNKSLISRLLQPT